MRLNSARSAYNNGNANPEQINQTKERREYEKSQGEGRISTTRGMATSEEK